MEQRDVSFIQDQIGYQFNNEDLLQQAFTRRSYSKENGGENNEVLEFIGDKVLDFIVVKLLAERYGYFSSECDDFDASEDLDEFIAEYQEDKLTEIKKKLVEKETLSNCIDNLGLANYLIMGKGDQKKQIQNEASVKEDLFEAIIGAIALDSQWDISVIQDSIDVMLNPEEIWCEDEINYIAEIQDWSLEHSGNIPLYHFEKTTMQLTWYIPKHPCCLYGDAEQDTQFSCELHLHGIEYHFVGYGKSKSDARKQACQLAYRYLEENDLFFTIQDEIENPSRDMAINQLEILARRGYFSLPCYEFFERHDRNGNPVWRCECHIEEKDCCFAETSSSKKDAKKGAAYSMLMYVLDMEE